MSLLMEARQIIQDNATWAQRVYVNVLDINQHDPNETSILIRNSTGSPGSYGSNKFHTYQGSIQIQIFLGLRASFDLEANLIKLMQAFNRQGWQILEIKPAIMDPDTHQLTATLLISKTKEAY